MQSNAESPRGQDEENVNNRPISEPPAMSGERPAASDPQSPSDGACVAPTPLLYTALSLFVIGFVVWVIFAMSGYKDTYSASHDTWRVGGTQLIEITLIQKDKDNLSCSSEKLFDGLHCKYDGAQKAWPSDTNSPEKVLQPYNTVKNELFMAAGLWQSLARSGEPLPSARFTVTCNYQVVGVAKTASLRWSPTGKFEPLKHSVPVGRLTDCVIPQ
jgi:hypothetical protein